MTQRKILTLLLFVGVVAGQQQVPCTQKAYLGEDSFVCVCNPSGCDSFGQVSFPGAGLFHQTVSSRDEFRFDQRTEVRTFNGSVGNRITINETDVRQRMYGFGGAFTDATGLNVATLSAERQQQFLRGYFSPDGLEYNIGRIPIAGSDFSTRPYSYDDVEGDIDLLYFNLTMEDYAYKLPYIKAAVAMSNRNILLFGSPWSPPSWMKENQMFNGSGGLLPQYNQSYANYFVKFVEAYKAEGVDLWGLTQQNEPTVGATEWEWNTCWFTAEEQRDFIRDYLGPTLNSSGLRYLKLMAADDNRETFPAYPTTVLEDSEAAAYIDGVAVHWYADSYIPVGVVTTVHNRFPDKFILNTEACNGFTPTVEAVKLGSWNRAERYARDIIEDTNHWSTGWVDWNMALDTIGSPNWAFNYVDSPIIINKTEDSFYRQPMYYAMGHFSKFIAEGYEAVSSTVVVDSGTSGTIEATALTDTTSQYIVVVVISTKDVDEMIRISDASGNQFDVTLLSRSITTIVYDKSKLT